MSSRKVLVCDDDKDILEMLEVALEVNGFDVVSEGDSTLVIGAIEKAKPDAVLLDLWMPLMSGDEIVRKLRADGKNKNLPVVVISASQDGKDVAMKAGADYYLEKPFDVDKLVSCLQTAMTR